MTTALVRPVAATATGPEIMGCAGMTSMRARATESARIGVQTPGVGALVASEHDADRRHVHRRQPTPPEHDVDKGAAGASVAVQERVDDLELSMHEAGLDHRR